MLEALRKSIAERVGLSSSYWLALSAICVGLVFGGGTVQWLPSEFICQAFGLVFLAVGLVQAMFCTNPSGLRIELGVAAAIPLLPAIQLVPLPPFLWSMLPGRQFLVEEFRAAGGTSLPWQPISLAPDVTWQALLSLALPLSVFLACLLLTFRERRLLSLVVLAFVGVSCVLALMQQLGGPDSPLRFYAITNETLPVGFFANRNHFAALLYCTLPLSAAWTISLALKPRRSRRTGQVDHKITLVYFVSAGGLVTLLLMEGLVHSRAGLSITVLALGLSLGLMVPFRASDAGKRAIKTMLGLLVVAAAVLGFYAFSSVVQQFDRDPIEDVRFTIIKGALRALWAFFPFGSGFGTFDIVYQQFELPGNADAEYINRAHDDIIETVIEGGVFSAAIFVLFAVWWARRLWSAWTSREFREASTIDAALARGAAFVPLLLVAHSFLDYPLRTEAIMSFLAFACGLTVPPINHGAVDQQLSAKRQGRTRKPGPASGAPRPRPVA